LLKNNLHFNVAADSAIFVCNSRATQKEFLEFFPHLESRCHVIPVNIEIEKDFKNIRLPEIIRARAAQKAEMKGKDYVLTIGALEPKKNLYNLLKAWEILLARHRNLPSLIIVAGKGWKSKKAESKLNNMLYKYPGRIMHLSKLPERELQYLLKNASFFTMPSIVEGFGIPVLNALKYNIPLAISDIPSFHEIAGEAALYFNPHDVQNIAEMLEKLLRDRSSVQNAQFRKQAEHQAKNFTSDKIRTSWLKLFS
jgi:glycosyltransferase involved in cell wall biosynthesis